MRRYSERDIETVAEILKKDGIISIPTDTVYGICAQINSEKAYDKLMETKNRPLTKSIPVMCNSKEQIKSIAIVNKSTEKLIDAFMPGPITLVLNKKENSILPVNNRGNQVTNEMAVRMAPTKMIEELIEKVERPLFMTSANQSGEPVCKSLDEIEKKCPKLDAIVEGDIAHGKASTIVDCTKEPIKIQRLGPISIEEINEVLKN